MKKILFILVSSSVLVSCGSKTEKKKNLNTTEPKYKFLLKMLLLYKLQLIYLTTELDQ